MAMSEAQVGTDVCSSNLGLKLGLAAVRTSVIWWTPGTAAGAVLVAWA